MKTYSMNEKIVKGQLWEGSSGYQVVIEDVDSTFVHYSWMQNGKKITHKKEHFAFKCRYALKAQPVEL
jgi:hypothetical protein